MHLGHRQVNRHITFLAHCDALGTNCAIIYHNWPELNATIGRNSPHPSETLGYHHQKLGECLIHQYNKQTMDGLHAPPIPENRKLQFVWEAVPILHFSAYNMDPVSPGCHPAAEMCSPGLICTLDHQWRPVARLHALHHPSVCSREIPTVWLATGRVGRCHFCTKTFWNIPFKVIKAAQHCDAYLCLRWQTDLKETVQLPNMWFYLRLQFSSFGCKKP